jgi:hypothetical protein
VANLALGRYSFGHQIGGGAENHGRALDACPRFSVKATYDFANLSERMDYPKVPAIVDS